MDYTKIIFIILVIIAAVLVLVTLSTSLFNDDKNETLFVRNNTTEMVNDTVSIDESDSDNEAQSNELDSDDNSYKTQDTGRQDSQGDPIYETQASSSGGQEEEGEYNVKWSPSEGII